MKKTKKPVTSNKLPVTSHQSPVTSNQSTVTKIKVVTVVGTRPEIIRLSRVMAKLDESEVIKHVTVHTGQNYDYELNQIFFEDLGIRKPDYFLESASTGNTACQTIGNIIAQVDKVLAEEDPDALLVLGDTNSCLAAYPAKRRKIPVFHMEAGNRCFDQRVPEEINRKIIDHISDINLPYSTIAREYLLREGLAPDRVIKTGSPMFEVLNYYRKKIESSDVLKRLDLKPNKFFLVSAHREENIDDHNQFTKLVDCLNKITVKHRLPVIVSTHPRTRKKLEEFGQSPVTSHQLLHFLKPLGFFDYVHLQTKAKATLSDSGTISEESSILNFPALNIRNAHERPEAMEEASVMMVGMNLERILQGLVILDSQKRKDERTLRLVKDYSMSNVSDKVLRIILSYVDYVKRVVWSEIE